MCDETICIYCLKDSSNAISIEHVIPEALGCKNTLPKGYVCDSCNNYFSNMDKNVLLNRYISIHVGTEEIPGKKGKIRRHIGEKLYFPKKDTLVMRLGPVTIPAGTHQGMKIDFRLEQSKEFDELLFARGIHKIAFNSYAYRFGHRNVLHSRFNNSRRTAIFRQAKWGEVVELRLLSLDFLVSLTGWRSEIESEISSDDTYIIRRKGQWDASSLLGLQK